MYYFLTSDNVKLYYEVRGEGNPVILIHGWACSHMHFKYQIEELSKKYKVIAIDLRGHGASEIPDYGLTISRLARDIKEIIEHLKLNKPSLVGWSMGTTIIFEFIKQFGCNDIDKLCIIDMTPKIYTDNESNEWKLGVNGQFSHKDSLEALVYMNANWDQYSKDFPKVVFSKKGCKDEKLEEWLIQQTLKNSVQVMIRMWIDMCAQDYCDMLDSISVPTLITHGEESALYSKENSQYLNKKIPNSRLVSFAACGHGLQFEDPEKFNLELINFIG